MELGEIRGGGRGLNDVNPCGSLPGGSFVPFAFSFVSHVQFLVGLARSGCGCSSGRRWMTDEVVIELHLPIHFSSGGRMMGRKSGHGRR